LRYREDVARAVVLRVEEQLTDASRQVSATAQIDAAAGTLADLAGNLEATAATTREHY
jgi:hypothetical protein